MLKLLHLSDLHIHSHYWNNWKLTRKLDYIAKHYPCHIRIVTGDVTDDGSLLQYHNARRLLLLAVGDNYICPGNHDYSYAGNLYDRKRAMGFDRHLRQTSKFFPRLSMPVVDILKDGEAVLVGLDSNIRTRHPFDFACGKIGLWQRYWLKKILNKVKRKYPDCVRIVYFHHHPSDRGPWTGMKDAAKLMKVLSGNCELILFGHKHRAQYYAGDTPMLAAGKLSDEDVVSELVIDGGKIIINMVQVIGE